MLLLNGPSEEMLEKIKLELNEDSDKAEHYYQLLKTWIDCHDYLPKNYDNELLRNFLRGSKHNLERAKIKLELYFTVKKNVPLIFANRDSTSEESKIAARTVAFVPLPNLYDGFRISVLRLMTSDISVFHMENFIRLFFMIGDIRVVEETRLAGDIIIMDAGNNITPAHIGRFANTIIPKALTVVHEAYPQRVKKIHVINLPNIAEKLISFVSSFLKKKIRDRIVIHKHREDILEHIPAIYLPDVYGGTCGNLSEMHEKWQQYLVDKNQWLQQQEKIVATGPVPKHLSHFCALDSHEAVPGSFRKLEID